MHHDTFITYREALDLLKAKGTTDLKEIERMLAIARVGTSSYRRTLILELAQYAD